MLARIRQGIQFLRAFSAMGHCSEFGYSLLATAANLVMRYAMGHCCEIGSALWATAWNEAVQNEAVQ